MHDARTYRTAPKPFRWLRLAALVWLLLTVTVLSAKAQRVQAFVEKDSVAIGDRFELAIVAEHNFLLQAVLPDYATMQIDADEDTPRLGDVELLSEKRRSGGYFGSERPGIRADTVFFEATTFALDTAYVPSIAIPFVAGGDTLTAASRPFAIPIASYVPAGATDIHDLAPLTPFPRAWWPWLALAALGLLLAVALVWLIRNQREEQPPPAEEEPQGPPPPSPYEMATRRLDDLVEHTSFDDPSAMKPFYVELVDILRTYLKGRLHIPAHEMTTRGLVSEIQRRSERGPFPNEMPERMGALLTQADLVKFADEMPGTNTARRAAEEVLALLKKIEASLPSTMLDTTASDSVTA